MRTSHPRVSNVADARLEAAITGRSLMDSGPGDARKSGDIDRDPQSPARS